MLRVFGGIRTEDGRETGRQYYHLTMWYETVPLFCACKIWVTNMNNVKSNKTILFDILDF